MKKAIIITALVGLLIGFSIGNVTERVEASADGVKLYYENGAGSRLEHKEGNQ